MPQDAFHIRRLTAELNTFLVGGKINRISQVNKDELTFIIYTGKSTVKLILSTNASGARVCLSATEKEPAPVAPNFCMLLRKHLQGAEILAVRQYEFERIVEIDLHCTTDFSESDRTLRCELMGKYSNIILTENDIILGALKTSSLEDNTHRVLLAGAKYLYPAPQDKLSPFDGAGIRSRLEVFHSTHKEGLDGETLSVWLFDNVSGLALPTAREIIRRAEEKAGALSLLLSPILKLGGKCLFYLRIVPVDRLGRVGRSLRIFRLCQGVGGEDQRIAAPQKETQCDRRRQNRSDRCAPTDQALGALG